MQVCDKHSDITASLARIEQKLDDLVDRMPAFVEDIEAVEVRVGVVEGIAKGTRSKLVWLITGLALMVPAIGYMSSQLIEHLKGK